MAAISVVLSIRCTQTNKVNAAKRRNDHKRQIERQRKTEQAVKFMIYYCLVPLRRDIALGMQQIWFRHEHGCRRHINCGSVKTDEAYTLHKYKTNKWMRKSNINCKRTYASRPHETRTTPVRLPVCWGFVTVLCLKSSSSKQVLIALIESPITSESCS